MTTTTSTRTLGRTGLDVSTLCVGTSALGSFPEQYGYEVDEGVAISTIRRVFDSSITFIDTSNEYGNGDSERRIGAAIAAAGGVPAGTVVATKVDPLRGSDDFSGARVRASVEESLERLGLDRLPLVYFHDPEKIEFDDAMASGGAVEALVALKEQGVIEHLGVAGGPIDLELRYVRTGIFDVVLSHNRYTLIDQTAAPLIDEAFEAGVGFVNAAPFGGGMLVKGPDVVKTYMYSPASQSTLDRVATIKSHCDRHGVPLAALALQFSTRNTKVASTVVGMSDPVRVDQTLELAHWAIPDELWDDVLPLTRA
ncbi:aldo/keto reductase [Herbiconiux daphne]|uniref:Aldo/keto reductase n=1 Tax=Herbiconiux daphne TaxID=2970914 RepID=A0ABT2H449_9MICO|nr:aldo/keto reductase [Herbiconiux daphne]MCS5734717.1 aldo/keto reductase [Herbiconiux daphne]